ncbi:ribosome silencing factor [Thiosulfativibrio zosterae]|uniref:Ribosomal silencing factor RsfS n=1 Tax=Thiosulfativibrio zosterae TaxID=2675053 RepID=A0A6F8PPS9_9GAMM|nr:ribosome silencing factor [Thiosulfativibrio zosterae]BBP44086.1 ribosomal silencing factor RsfS [Thiosulfativibrio zosterae]
MNLQTKQDIIYKALDDGKARDIKIMDVSQISTFTNLMVVATGTSTTHVRSLGSRVAQEVKDAGEEPLGVEAGPEPDWVLVDLGDAIVHVMTESARAHYALEKLWEVQPASQTIAE